MKNLLVLIGLIAISVATPAIVPHIMHLATNNVNIEYAVHGAYTTSDHIPVIALHGYTDAWYSYDLLMKNSPNVKIYAISLPCYGSSTKDDVLASSYDTLAAVVVEFMDVMGIDVAVIMGHSMSSLLAPHVAHLYPERAAGVVLVGPRATFATDPSMVGQEGEDPNSWGFLPWVSSVMSTMDPEATLDYQFCYDWQVSTVYKPIPEDFLEGCVQETMKVPAKCWLAGVNAMSSVDYTETLTTITVPFIMVFGDHEIFPWEQELGGQEAIIKAVPQLSIVKLEGIGHASHWEAPVTIALILKNFMKNL
jgi:pimeloyl-ACP methyl ester carboxylesterase